MFKIRHAWANDYDLDTCKTYIRNICPNEPDTVYHADVRKFDLDDLPPIVLLHLAFLVTILVWLGNKKV